VLKLDETFGHVSSRSCPVRHVRRKVRRVSSRQRADPNGLVLVFNIAVIAVVFGIVFVAELPDKTAIASLVLGTRYPIWWVFTGVAAAFAVHVALAVAAGALIAELPHRLVEGVVAALFLVGAALLWRRGSVDEDVEVRYDQERPGGFLTVAGIGFGVVFLAEFGDITQLLTANLAARYDAPLSVGIGAVLGLWAVGLIAILGGKSLLQVLPVKVIVRAAAVIMIGLAAYSIYSAIKG
jgi:putative Ca2+/H+ antiporter (TMEM165/GDT1 family)